MSDDPEADRPAAGSTFWQTLGAVFWAFFGVRKKSDYARDAARLNPVHVIVAGVLGAAVFVFVLILIVRSVVK